MSEEPRASETTLALSTRVEEAFISPLTAIRGALEILRDYPDLNDAERQGFVTAALSACARLEAGIDELSASVYSAGRRGADDAEPAADASDFSTLIRLDREAGIIDLDFSDLEFSNAAKVNEVYDAIDQVVLPSNRRWHFLVNYTNCRVWPEAWVAYAHRSKKISMNYGLSTVRYAEPGDSAPDPDICPSRDAALEKIAAGKN